MPVYKSELFKDIVKRPSFFKIENESDVAFLSTYLTGMLFYSNFAGYMETERLIVERNRAWLSRILDYHHNLPNNTLKANAVMALLYQHKNFSTTVSEVVIDFLGRKLIIFSNLNNSLSSSTTSDQKSRFCPVPI